MFRENRCSNDRLTSSLKIQNCLKFRIDLDAYRGVVDVEAVHLARVIFVYTARGVLWVLAESAPRGESDPRAGAVCKRKTQKPSSRV